MPPSKRNSIIKATVEIVAEAGLQGAPTIKIAERAGVAEITIFRNFKTKEGLLEATFDELLADVQDYVRTGHDTFQPIKERFFALCNRFCSYLKAKPENFSFLEQYLHSAQGWLKRPDMIHESDVDFEDFPLISLLDQGRKNGEIKPLPMPILTGLVIGAILNYKRHQSLKETNYPKHIQEEIIQACWDGIAR